MKKQRRIIKARWTKEEKEKARKHLHIWEPTMKERTEAAARLLARLKKMKPLPYIDAKKAYREYVIMKYT